jgi:hypothetical protein
MSEIALAKINSFASKAEQTDFVQPSEQLITIPASLLQALQDRIDALEDRIINQDEKIAALEATQDSQAENELNMLRLINDLRKDKEPQPMQRDRGEILRALLAANGGKMLAKEARQMMHLSRSQFSQLLATTKDNIEVKPYHLRKNQKMLFLV